MTLGSCRVSGGRTRSGGASPNPAEPSIAPADAKVHRWDFYYLQPGKEAEALDIARDVKALYEKKGLHDAWNVYTAVMGSDMPFLVVSSTGKDAADIESREAAAQAALGEAWGAIEQRILKVVRRTSTKYVWPRPDLSIPAPESDEM